MKAIFTKYHGPTNTRGSRISASDEDGNRVTIARTYALDGDALHRRAAEALCLKMGWTGALAGGSHKRGYVFVFVDGLQRVMQNAVWYPGEPDTIRELQEALQDISIEVRK